MRCEHFKIQELVSPEVFAARGDRAWELLDPAALRSLDLLRKKFGPCKVNDWHQGGNYKLSGLRPFDAGLGAAYSQHKFGRAFDCKFSQYTPEQVYEFVLANPKAFPEITVIEDVRFTPTWFHFDTRNHDRGGIWVVTP